MTFMAKIKSNIVINRGGRLLIAAAAAAVIASAPFGPPAGAADTREIAAYKEPVSKFDYDFAGTLFKFIAATAAGIVVLLAIKKYMKPYSFHGDTDNIKVIDYKSIAPDRFIYVVEVFDTVYVLGVAPGGITKVDEIKDKETIEAIRLRADKNIKGKLFSEYLQKFMPAAGKDEN